MPRRPRDSCAVGLFFRATCTAACGLVSLSSWTIETVCRAGLLDRRVDLSDRHVAAFWPGGAEGREIARERDRIPDHEVELRLAAASVVVIVVAAAGRHAKDQHETGYCGEELFLQTSHAIPPHPVGPPLGRCSSLPLSKRLWSLGSKTFVDSLNLLLVPLVSG